MHQKLQSHKYTIYIYMTPKSDGHAKVRRLVGDRDDKARWLRQGPTVCLLQPSHAKIRRSMFRRLFTRHATPMLREKKLRL